jgi:hypothetical protein
MEYDSEFRTISKFDMGVSILIRINEILNYVAEARISGNFKVWRNCLMAVSGEIEDTYSLTEEKEYNRLLEKVNPLIGKSVPRFVLGKQTPVTDLNEEEYNELYQAMRELDKFIRAQLNNRNMLLKKKGDVRKSAGIMSLEQ